MFPSKLNIQTYGGYKIWRKILLRVLILYLIFQDTAVSITPPSSPTSLRRTGRGRSSSSRSRSQQSSGADNASPKQAMIKVIDHDHALEILDNNKPKIKKEKDLHEAIINHYLEELREISLLYATMPVTQVSVKRLFSALKLLKSDLRMTSSQTFSWWEPIFKGFRFRLEN